MGMVDVLAGAPVEPKRCGALLVIAATGDDGSGGRKLYIPTTAPIPR
jgi:hypothetical protein